MLAMAVKIAKWKQIAIVTTTNLPAEMLFIKRLYKEAISSGLEIVHFDAVPTFNRDVVLELKQSDARVVYFSSVNYRSCQELLCLMHREGITAPTYVFITTFFCLPAKSDDPPFDWCTLDMLNEQMNATFFTGTLPSSPFPFQNST